MTTTALTDMTHPPDQQLAAFVDGKLDERNRRTIIEHLSQCDECYAVFQSASEFAEQEAAAEPARGTVVRPHFRRPAVAALLASAAALTVVFGPMLRGRYDESRLQDAAAQRDVRVVEGRLGGEPQYRRMKQTLRGDGDEAADENELLLQGRAYRLIEAAGKNPTATNLRRAGIAWLLLEKRDQAIEELDRARRAGGDDVKLYTALAAAYQAKARATSDAKAAAKAVEAAEKAWSLEQTPVTAWNRALALEEAASPNARAAWQDYLKLDSTSEWAKEVSADHLADD
jgi:tetratricopeptide (TPR) repeat protein